MLVVYYPSLLFTVTRLKDSIQSFSKQMKSIFELPDTFFSRGNTSNGGPHNFFVTSFSAIKVKKYQNTHIADVKKF